MSPNKTLYIREEDQDAWERADAAAHAARQSLSQYVSDLIRRHAPEIPADDGEMRKITVEVGAGITHTEGFTGRWLAWDETTDYRQGIALTKGGQLAWYEYIPMAGEGDLLVYPDLDSLESEVQEKNWPDGDGSEGPALTGLQNFREMVASAADALGQEHVIWRDI